ncbi:MAG: T9SS type A sorting domain-containing protein [Bacteroidetes bacterium]|nr:T9SS type A sorting domain-containing protein [Bacteroidota bacterium]MBL6943791.1 T9SS type A sorting domain-containing protein [Bacteroidales bacterium]
MKKDNTLRFLHIILIIPFLHFIFIGNMYAQIPTTQDCKGAIPVCDYVYIEESTAWGFGNYYEIPTGQVCPNHCMDGEHNSRWYIWTVIEAGNLRFEITPQIQTDDYDWAVFNLTNYTCDDIWSNPGWTMSSCNAAGGPTHQGPTGVNTLFGGTSNCNNGGPTNKWNIDLPVYEGETYVLIVSDWTQTPGGYTLDFSASTAVIFDDQRPYLDYIGGDLITACGTNELFIKFNENVKCSSVQPYDFELDGPGGPFVIDSIYGETCDLGGNNEREYTLYFTPPIYQGGDFTLEINQFSFISDACNNYALTEIYDFFVALESPIADAGEDIDIPYAGTATLDGSASSGSGYYSYSWEPSALLDNPLIPNPTTVTLTSSTQFFLSVSDQQSLCVGEDTMWVNVVGGPLGITMNASSNEICNGQRVDLFVNPDGGAGNYSFLWTSNPSGFNSTEQYPSDFPVDDVWYIVKVTDGYTEITDSVFVKVNQIPIAYAGDDQVINEGTTTTLNGSASGGAGNYGYQWEPSSWLETNNIPNPVTLPLYDPTVFTLLVTDENGCTSIPDNVLINASGGGLSAFPWSDSTEICLGQSTTISANATGGGLEYTYEWTSVPPGFTSAEAMIFVTPYVTTQYNLLLIDQFENEFEANIIITVNYLPEINLIPFNATVIGIDTIIVCVRDTVMLDAGHNEDPPNTEYFWLESNLANRYFIASTNGNWTDYQSHAVRVTNGMTGCCDTGRITILFDFNECAIGIPEKPTNLASLISIQPNPNKGSFEITVKKNINILNLSIINIQGKVVFNGSKNESYIVGYPKQINAGLSPGVYFVHIKTLDELLIKKIVVY